LIIMNYINMKFLALSVLTNKQTLWVLYEWAPYLFMDDGHIILKME